MLPAPGQAAALALAVGFQAEYFGNAEGAEGMEAASPDYIALFPWGVGTDRLKSFLAKLPGRGEEEQTAS